MKFEELEPVNINIINGTAWAQQAWSQLCKGLELSFANWVKTVVSVSSNPENIEKWLKVYLEEFEEHSCEMVSDIVDMKEKMLNKAENLMKNLQQCCRDLHMSMPAIGAENLCLTDEIDQIKKKLEEYEKMKKVRLDELDRLHQKQLEMCTSLGKVPKHLPLSPLPSAEQVDALQKLVEKMESVKYEREEKFLELKGEMLAVVEELQYSPKFGFERDVLLGQDSAFMVTDFNMKELERLHKQLNQELVNVKEDVVEKWATIEDLWTKLEVDLSQRSKFMEKHKGYSLSTLEGLNNELKRLKALKMENIKVFIEKYKSELLSLWDKCHCTEELRNFKFFNCDLYTEDLLEMFEIEIRRWKNYYKENKTLLKLLEDYDHIWRKLIDLEENATGQNRYKNRGGTLLQEERERNKLQKKIPLIEKNLLDLAEAYEVQKNISFNTWGVTVTEKIESMHADRENARKQKLSTRKVQRDDLTTAKSSNMALYPSTSTSNLRKTPISLFPATSTTDLKKTPISANKRKMLTTPLTEVKKRPKLDVGRKILTETKKKKVISVRRSLDRSSKERKLNRNKEKSRMQKNSTLLDEEYEDFQSQLSTKSTNENCRSTLYYGAGLNKIPPTTPATQQSRMPLRIRNAPATPSQREVRKQTNNNTPKGTPHSAQKNKNYSLAKTNLKLNF